MATNMNSIHPETAYAYVACGWQDDQFWQSVDWESVRESIEQVNAYVGEWHSECDGGCIVKLTATFEVIEALNGTELPGVEPVGQRALFSLEEA